MEVRQSDVEADGELEQIPAAGAAWRTTIGERGATMVGGERGWEAGVRLGNRTIVTMMELRGREATPLPREGRNSLPGAAGGRPAAWGLGV